MKLKQYKHHIPVLIEGTGSMGTQSFAVGGTIAGSGLKIESIEATPLGIVVRVEAPHPDLLLTQFGYGVPAEKMQSAPGNKEQRR